MLQSTLSIELIGELSVASQHPVTLILLTNHPITMTTLDCYLKMNLSHEEHQASCCLIYQV